MVRYGEVLSLSEYLRVDRDEGEGEDKANEVACDVWCVVAPEYAPAALCSAVVVSFAALSASTDVDVLHSSKRMVQLWSEAPVVSIAWVHILRKQVTVPGGRWRPGVVPGGLSDIRDR